MSRSMVAMLFAMLAVANGVQVHQTTMVAKNPIRKVVTMLQSMIKKVEAEGEKEEELYKKFMCYCKTGAGTLEKSIAAAEAKIPELQAAVEEGGAEMTQLEADLKAHKSDREAAKTALAEGQALRDKQAAEYAKEKADADANIAAITKAVAALEKGMGGAFLQTTAANVVRNLVQSGPNMDDGDRQEVMAFLAGQSGSMYAPQSGEITGILKTMGDEMVAGLAEATAAEEAAIANFDAMMAAAKKQVEALTAAIEEKTVRVGELGVELVNMKEDLEDTTEALAEDQKFLADLAKNCATKDAEWEEIVAMRSQEVVALTETIKILNSDDALELFKKTLPSPSASFVQVRESSKSMRSRALAAVHAAQQASNSAQPQLNLIAIALHGKTVGFEKVLTMIDEMVALLKDEQVGDDEKKTYCTAELDKTDDTKKGLERSISQSTKAIEDAKESIATLTSEIEALAEGIKALDKSVAEATENRKEENAEYKELMASDAAAKEIIGFAKNRLNKFYNPKLYVPPPKRELSAEDKITTAFGGTAAPTPAPGGISGTGVTALAQVAPPPPPESFKAYTTKGEESNGVMAMMDLLVKDLDKEMQTAEADEKDAQADYETMMEESAKKRAMDSKSITENEGIKADTQAALEKHTEEKDASSKELMATLESIQALHSDCDWLMQYFDVRKEARASEIESLGKAKAVLSGADYSLLQTIRRSVRM